MCGGKAIIIYYKIIISHRPGLSPWPGPSSGTSPNYYCTVFAALVTHKLRRNWKEELAKISCNMQRRDRKSCHSLPPHATNEHLARFPALIDSPLLHLPLVVRLDCLFICSLLLLPPSSFIIALFPDAQSSPAADPLLGAAAVSVCSGSTGWSAWLRRGSC